MRRRLALIGLAVPLAAVIGALLYLYAFGTSEPTFDTAARELARTHTLVRLRDEPPAALIVPTHPEGSVTIVVILPDDERHVWSATRESGLLAHVDSSRLALLPATGASTLNQLTDLVELAKELLVVERAYIAAFAGEPVTSLCREITQAAAADTAWSGVAVVANQGASAAPPDACGKVPVRRIDAEADPSTQMVQWILEPQ